MAVRGPEGGAAAARVRRPSQEDVEVDRSWFRGAGMRASESHRVIFSRTPVLAILGEPGELVQGTLLRSRRRQDRRRVGRHRRLGP